MVVELAVTGWRCCCHPSSPPLPSNPPRADCRLVHVNHIARHGSRHISKVTKPIKMIAMLTDAGARLLRCHRGGVPGTPCVIVPLIFTQSTAVQCFPACAVCVLVRGAVNACRWRTDFAVLSPLRRLGGRPLAVLLYIVPVMTVTPP